jgi:hypothetical protein
MLFTEVTVMRMQVLKDRFSSVDLSSINFFNEALKAAARWLFLWINIIHP